jgi:hypothetical protein
MMNKSLGDIHIAGSLTTDDWKMFKSSLDRGGDKTQWEKAFTDLLAHTPASPLPRDGM